jgi:NADH-quinone oxidoreductase subunit G
MATVLVNGKEVEIGASERLNCIQAAAKVGVEIPAYCWHPALSVVASCRMCLVEVGDKKPDGTVQCSPSWFRAVRLLPKTERSLFLTARRSKTRERRLWNICC